MTRLFLVISAFGISYLAFLFFIGGGKKGMNNSFRQQLRLRALHSRFESEKFQGMLNNAGLNASAQKINFFRYAAAFIFLSVQLLSDFIREIPFAGKDFLIAVCIILVSSPSKYLPLGWILKRMHLGNIVRKNGELISFLRLYENNRLRKRGYVEFGAYCAQVATHFEFIRQELFELSERSVDEGTEQAIIWFCSQYPDNHPFISDIRSILLSTESMNNDEEAIQYLSAQSKIISKISSDQYQRKWSTIGDVSSIITVIPSIATFLMIVCLAMQYIMLIKGNFNNVSLFQ